MRASRASFLAALVICAGALAFAVYVRDAREALEESIREIEAGRAGREGEVMTHDAEELRALIDKLTKMGTVDPDLLAAIDRAQGDPALMQVLMKELEAAAGPYMEPPLDIGSFYRDGDGRLYDQRWPLSPSNSVVAAGFAFADLDRKTQFFVLFAEWQRREAEGMLALTQGNLEGAETTFNECLQRAAQIDVGELRARSYEDLARVAECRGQSAKVAQLLDEAEQARARAV